MLEPTIYQRQQFFVLPATIFRTHKKVAAVVTEDVRDN